MDSAAREGSTREHCEEFLVRSYEVEPDGRLRLVVLLRMLQEAAWQHASRLGKGFHHRDEGTLFWVLSRLRLTMNRYPRWGELFTVRTFPVGTQRMLAVREFALVGGDGETIGRASSGWLIVDGGKGRPLRPEPVVADIVPSPSEYEGDLERVDPLDRTSRASAPSRVRYHDIDQYRHVNNASYLEWVTDAIAADRPTERVARRLAIDFLKETLLDDAYRIVLETDRDTDRFEVRRDVDGEPTARGYLCWSDDGAR
jgi:acyl-ACP thioesterase